MKHRFWQKTDRTQTLLITLTFLLVTAIMAGCVPRSTGPVQTSSMAPEVSYMFNTDQELIQAKDQARNYCRQYASTPSIEGTITSNSDGSKRVTFQCVKTPVNAPEMLPQSYDYSTDKDLLRAMNSADAYCAQTGQAASYNISTTSSGTQMLTYQCVPR